MQDTLPSALVGGGGLGLARQLYKEMQLVSTVLEAELLAHLDTQIASAQHLLELMLAQGAAIRERDIDAVLARLAEIQTEMGAAASSSRSAPRCCSAPAPRSASRPRPSRSSACARSSPPARRTRRMRALRRAARAARPKSPASTASTAR